MLKALQKQGLTYKIISLSDVKVSPSALLDLLTDKQREVLAAAFKQGYYDIPRKMRSDELALKLHMRNATFVAHRRKTERQLMAEILS